MRDKGSFLRHYKQVRVEGFEQQRLLTQCLSRDIRLKKIRFYSDIEMSFQVTQGDWERFKRIAGNKYKITIEQEKGIFPVGRRLFSKKSTIAGMIILALILLYQGTFVAEIQITGYEKYMEEEILQALADCGIYAGARKNLNPNDVEALMFEKLDNLSWIGIEYNGNLVEVTIVEGTITPPPEDTSQPCHIIADRDAYIEKVVAKEGEPAVGKGNFVREGDILITGVIPIEDKAYGNGESTATERYVHASGEVWARIPNRFVYYQERFEIEKEPTGNVFYGFSLELGDFSFNSAHTFWMYDSSIYEEKKLLNGVWPLKFSLGVNKVSEVELYRKERGEEEISKQAELQAREAAKENLGDSTQILNKDLSFSIEENIIKVSIMLESMEEIGEIELFTPMEAPAGPDDSQADQ